MSENKAKKRLNHERDNGKNKSPDFLAEEPQKNNKRARLDNQEVPSEIIKNTPSFGIDRNSALSQSECQSADFGGREKADDPLLNTLLTPEELSQQKKKKYDGKFEELSDQFRQKGITKEMRQCIDQFSQNQQNYKRIDLTDKVEQKKVAVLNRE